MQVKLALNSTTEFAAQLPLRNQTVSQIRSDLVVRQATAEEMSVNTDIQISLNMFRIITDNLF